MLKYPEIGLYEYVIDPPYTAEQKIVTYEYLIAQHKDYLKHKDWYKNTYNSFTLDNNIHFIKIYNLFELKCREIFGNITLSPNNRRSAFIQISDRNSPNAIHNHLETAVINCVYYFNVPDDKTGKISFFKEDKVYDYQPVNNSMVIFPNYLDHLPSCCDSDEYRIAVNMEIICEENVWN